MDHDYLPNSTYAAVGKPSRPPVIHLRESLSSGCVSLASVERVTREIEGLLGGDYGISGAGQEITKTPGVCEVAYDMACRIQRLCDSLETIKAMIGGDQGDSVEGFATASTGRR